MTSDGRIAGLDPSEVSIIEAAGVGGVAYGFGASTQALNRSAGSSAGDRGAFAVSGVLPGVDVGAVPDTGSATMRGRYEAVEVRGVEQSANVSNWTETQLQGAITIEVDFTGRPDEGRDIIVSGTSDDGNLKIRSVELAQDGSGRITYGEARLNGATGGMDGFLGEDGLVSAFSGAGTNRIFAGGVVATP